MKKIIIILVALIVAMSCSYPVAKYYRYIKASEELLWRLEEINEYHGIHWGDTVCSEDVWVEYNEARASLGMSRFPYYKHRYENETKN